MSSSFSSPTIFPSPSFSSSQNEYAKICAESSSQKNNASGQIEATRTTEAATKDDQQQKQQQMTSEFNVPLDAFRDKELKWNGWGYAHSRFELCPENGHFCMRSKRYSDLDGRPLPLLRPWVEKNLGVNVREFQTPSVSIDSLKVGPPNRNRALLEFLRSEEISHSEAPFARLFRSHGQTLAEILAIRTGNVGRVPDLVIWPRNEAQIQTAIEGARRFGVLLIPVGGGTSVSQALLCPPPPPPRWQAAAAAATDEEQLCICALDMCLMCRILGVDTDNMTATVEAGILGQDLERKLNELGLTCGHEPDSLEFSTLGGWISTRASGMKKNKYGNIEDLLLSARLCTTRGILQPRNTGQVPRLSAGPDLLQLLLGSEGQLGVISQATIKVFPCPARRCFGAIIFPDFESGVRFFRAVALRKWQPASLRLVDNAQFQMGQAMRTHFPSFWQSLARLYLTHWRGFRVEQMVAATCVFEGSQEEVETERKRLFSLAASPQFGGIRAPDENGQFGYRLTFAIAYLRDLALDLGIVGESFETSVPWSRVLDLCRNVKKLLVRETRKQGIQRQVLATCRVTQVYDSGVCVYFYFAFNYRGVNVQRALHIYEHVENAARNEIIASGGSISHHHGVGKIRKRWLPVVIGPLGISATESMRAQLDPDNVFASGNLTDSLISTQKKISKDDEMKSKL